MWWRLFVIILIPLLRIRQRLSFAPKRPRRVAVRQATWEAEPVEPCLAAGCCGAGVNFALTRWAVNLICVRGFWNLVNAAPAFYFPHFVLPHLHIRQRIRIIRSLRIAVSLCHRSLPPAPSTLHSTCHRNSLNLPRPSPRNRYGLPFCVIISPLSMHTQ